VRKEFEPQKESNSAELELRNLSVLKRLKHPNVVELLGAYTYGGKHNLIFPFAQGGSLADLMKDPRPSSFRRDEDILIALAGLCSAVCTVHEQLSDDRTLLGIGCHHDLKPANVLVDNSRFLLADFGLSRFKDSSEDSQTCYKSVVGSCVAPECENFNNLQDTKARIGRSSDIWSLGCIILETWVYMKEGPEGVTGFSEERRHKYGCLTVRRFHHGPDEENPAVLERLTHLKHSKDQPDQLLARLLLQMLQLNPETRLKAGEVETGMWFVAIATISQQIQDLYERIWEMTKSVQAFVEQERFSSWFESCKILYNCNDATPANQWPPRPYSSHQDTLNSLLLIRDTLEYILPKVQQPSRPVYQSLEELNDSLLAALPPELQVSAQIRLELQILNAKVVEREDLENSGHEVQKIGMLLTIQKMTSLVGQYSHPVRHDLYISPQRLRQQKKIGAHYLGTLDSSGSEGEIMVLYESKKCGQHHLDDSIREQLYSRLETVARLLQQATASGFRVLDCFGYFHDPAKLSCGLVYKLPTSPDLSSPEVVTLSKVLATREEPPDLGKRILLSRHLTTSVLEFHKVGWLQREVSSFNIAFVFSAESSWRDQVEKPYFLGFSNSRPNQQSAFSEHMNDRDRSLLAFKHPEYLRKDHVRYRPGFDYYSLGLVLLEIGCWKSLDKMTENINGSPEDVLSELLRNRLPRLGQYMGVIYRDVVKACLTWDTQGATDVNSFAEKVVEQLARCVI
jgi:serine/threonine protein kinase